MEKTNSSNSSMCEKICQALASFSSCHQEPRPTSSLTNTDIQAKPHLPQHHKDNTESEGDIPIKFDYPTTPTSMGNRNSAVPSAHGQAAKVAPPAVGNSERGAKMVVKVEAEPKHVTMQGKTPKKAQAPGSLQGQHGVGVHSEQQGKKSHDVNDIFSDYIKRAKHKIRTVSNIGRGQSIRAPDHEANAASDNEKEPQKDHFSDFIQRAKKKFRTTSSIGRTSTSKSG